MKTVKLNDWLSLIANIGAVVGIFLLIQEVNHASRISEVEAYQTRIRDIQEVNMQMALSDTLALIFEKEEEQGIDALTPSEFMRVRAWYASIMRGMQGQYYQYQEGFLEREAVDRTLEDIAAGIYAKWVAYDLLQHLEIKELRDEIELRMSKEPLQP